MKSILPHFAAFIPCSTTRIPLYYNRYPNPF